MLVWKTTTMAGKTVYFVNLRLRVFACLRRCCWIYYNVLSSQMRLWLSFCKGAIGFHNNKMRKTTFAQTPKYLRRSFDEVKIGLPANDVVFLEKITISNLFHHIAPSPFLFRKGFWCFTILLHHIAPLALFFSKRAIGFQNKYCR